MRVYTFDLHRGTAYAGTDRDAAIRVATEYVNDEAARRPGGATPHVVVQAWESGVSDWHNDVHVYAGREVVNA